MLFPIAKAILRRLVIVVIAVVATLGLNHLHAQAREGGGKRLTEVLRISGAEEDLSAVGKITRTSDGTLWVSQPQDGNVLAFSQVGLRGQSFGRRGDGPGEFRVASGIFSDGSNLWVFDRESRRLIRFGLDGRQVDTRQVSHPAGLPVGTSLVSAGPFGAFYRSRPTKGKGHGNSLEITWFSWDNHSAVPDTVAVAPYAECSYGSPDGRSAVVIPLCPNTRSALSDDGRFLVIVHPVEASDQNSMVRVLLYNSAGQLIFQVDVELWRSRLERPTRDSVIANLRARAGPGQSRLVESLISSGGIPRTWPPVVDVAVSEGGVVWFVTHAGAAGTRMVCRVKADTFGRSECASLPSAYLGLAWAGRESIVLVEDTEEGFHDVVLYQVNDP